jgi:hypothetical protein
VCQGLAPVLHSLQEGALPLNIAIGEYWWPHGGFHCSAPTSPMADPRAPCNLWTASDFPDCYCLPMEAHHFWSSNHGKAQAMHNLLLEHWHLEGAPSVQQVTNLPSVLSTLEALGSSMVEPSAMTTPFSQCHNLSGLINQSSNQHRKYRPSSSSIFWRVGPTQSTTPLVAIIKCCLVLLEVQFTLELLHHT